MMSGKSVTRKKSQRGAFVLEAVIAITLVSLFLAGILQFERRTSNVKKGLDAAEKVSNISSAFESYFWANRSDIINALKAVDTTSPSVRKHCIVAANPLSPIAPGSNGVIAWNGGSGATGLKTCAMDMATLMAYGFWPIDSRHTFFDEEHNVNWRYAAIFRGILNGSGNIEDVEMIVIPIVQSGTPANMDKISKDRKETLIGALQSNRLDVGFVPIGTMGACRAISPSSAKNVMLCGNSWSVFLEDFITPANLNSIKSQLPSS